MPNIDHLGIAVQDIEAVTTFFAKLFRALPYKTEEVEAQGVRTHFIRAGSTKIELLESISSDSPVARYLEKRGEGIHHVAFEVPNIRSAWKHAKSLGYEPLGEGPSEGADNKLIFFLHPRQTHGMLIEFCQSQRVPLDPVLISAEGGRLAVYELGEATGPPVVILHGAAGCTTMETERITHRLSSHYHVLALDFGGHGRSDAFKDTSFTPDFFLQNVERVFDYFSLKKAHIFGFSLGGFIALLFAATHPDRVKKLAVHAVNLFWDEQLMEKMVSRVDATDIQQSSPELSRFLSDMHGADKWVSLFERSHAYSKNIPRFKTRYEKAFEVSARTLVSAVHDDDLFSIDSPVNLHKRLKNSKLAVIPGRRHALQNLDLDLYIPILLKHLEGL